MRRRWWHFVALVSLLLFLVVVGLWIESGFYSSYAIVDGFGDGAMALTHRQGFLAVGWIHTDIMPPGRFEHVRRSGFFMIPPAHLDGDTWDWRGLGFAWAADQRFVILPHWLLSVLAAVLPVAWWFRWRRRKPDDPHVVPCAGCGYDLRGNRETGCCPECGRVMAA